MELQDKQAEEFVTVVNVQGGSGQTIPTPQTSPENFVTVLSIGTGKRDVNGIDPAHPEEEVEVYRLPGERLGFGLKFEGGNKTSERVRRLFIQSCAEQSPASRAKCSWGHLGEGDEVLSIDDVPVTQMTRLDCVRRLKESQLVIKLKVRCRGALRPEVVSAERKLSQQEQQQRSKVPPELPAAPPPVPPRKLRHAAQANRGLADGEASPGSKKTWDSPKSSLSSQTGSPQSQSSFRSAASSTKSSNYESCNSSPKNGPSSKNESPKDSPKAHVSPVLNKTKQEPTPAEAQSYLDARSQDGSSTHGSTSDDTSSSLSTVVDRFSTSDRFSTTSTTSTTSEQFFHSDNSSDIVNGDATLLLSNGLDFDNPDFLLSRLAHSETRTFVESRGDVERVTAVVAPNTVLIEETPTLQPPLSFQDAPLSYGHEPRPGIFYSADLAADSRTHFRPIKDDAEMVEKVFNGEIKEAPPLPVRNHVNRISVNQQQQENKVDETDSSKMPLLPPKPMPRKDVKAKRKRPPPPPPPPRREPPPPIPEARNLDNSAKKEENKINESEAAVEKRDNEIINEENVNINSNNNIEVELIEEKEIESIMQDENANKRKIEIKSDPESDHTTNNVLEIVEMKKAKLTPQKTPSRTSDEYEVPEREANHSETITNGELNRNVDVELKNSINKKLFDMSRDSTVSIEIEDTSFSEDLEKVDDIKEENDETNEVEIFGNAEDKVVETSETENLEPIENSYSEENIQAQDEDDIIKIEIEKDSRLIDIRRNERKYIEEDDMTDESDGEDYYWQSNLATIGEEEETNSLEYNEANEDPFSPINETIDAPLIIENVSESPSKPSVKNAKDEPDCVSRITRDSSQEDKKQDKNAVNGRMDNLGVGGQRLPPDGDEFPTAYQEFTSTATPTSTTNKQYQYVTTRESLAANGDLDRGESSPTNFISAEKAILVAKTLNIAETRSQDAIPTSVSNYVLYSTQKTTVVPTNNIVMEKKIEIAGYYSKETKSSEDEMELDGSPPPLPLTGPPKVDKNQDKKFSANGDLWRQDNKSEKSVKDKIAMFSSQSNLEAPLFPTPITSATSSPNRRLSKHKSSDDVFGEEKTSPISERTQSFFDLSHHQKTPSLPQSSPPSSPGSYNSSNYLQKTIDNNKYLTTSSNSSSKSNSPLNSFSSSPYNGTISQSGQNKSFDATVSLSSSPPKSQNGLTRATSFSGSSPFSQERLQISTDLLGNSPGIARTNSLASTFKRPNDDMRKSSLNQLIEQRRKGISKLRGLVIPEKDAVPIDQPITDLPEIKSRDSILVNQVPRSNIQDKWGSQSSLASNASTVSSSMRTNGTFKMPAPKILSSYSPAFKRKSLSVYGSSQPNNNTNNSSAMITNSKNNTNNQLISPASEAPKSLESICSPTRSDYSFDFVSSSGSPENNLPVSNKPKLNCQRKIGRNEYDDSDNDSAVSSSQSSISRGFSPPMSPVPSDRSTISSERSYLSSETHYQRPQLILDNNKTNGTTIVPEKNIYSIRSNFTSERSYPSEKSLNSKPIHQPQSQQIESVRSSQIPQRQVLKRSSSTETNSSNSSTLTTGSQASAESLSRRVLKPQSVEAINRKNILASARCRSGRDLNGSPLIQRKFSDDEEATAGVMIQQENGGFVNVHRVPNGSADCIKPQIKIAYIEITENVVGEEKFANHKQDEEEKQQQPRLPAKRTIIQQTKNVPSPLSRPPKPEPVEASNDMKSWVRAEMRTLNTTNPNSYEPRKKSPLCDADNTSSNGNGRNFRSKSTLTLNEQCVLRNETSEVDLIDTVKPKSRSNIALKKSADDHNDLLTVLTTKSRSRSAIHVEDTSYGKLKSQMSLEDILAVKCDGNTKLPRSQSIATDVNRHEKNGIGNLNSSMNSRMTNNSMLNERTVQRSNSTDSWSEEKMFSSKIPSLNRGNKSMINNMEESIEVIENGKMINSSKIPMARNLSRRSASVTDMKKVFEKADVSSSSGTSSPGSQSNNTTTHNRFPSLDSSVEESIIRPAESNSDQERFSGEQFGSISSLASSTSLISQQELAQLVEEANLEEPRGGHDVVVVLLHKENPSGSVGITLAGGIDCETKEITIHRVLSHSIADKDGSVQRGDRILSINGRSMRGLTHRESLAVLKQPRSEVVLVISRAKIEESSIGKLRSRTESVETIVEGYETNGVTENTAWGPASMVSMYKDGAGLGFSLEGGRDSPLGDRPLLIKKIFTGGAAEKTGALRAGDQLLEVNKRDVSRMSRIEAWSLMKKLPDGEVNLLVRHPATKSS